MSAERDDLAKLIFITDNAGADDPEAEWPGPVAANDWKGTHYAYAIADGLLAAGYRKATP